LNIRQANILDLDAYIELLAHFHESSPMRNVAPYDPDGIRAFLTNSLENTNILLLVGELDGEIVGVTSCLLYPLYFSPNYHVAQELWWWLTPKARGSGVGKAMFKGIEAWAKEKDAKALFMIALEDERAAAMEKVYFRAGFEPLEKTFIKEL
jgi:N-acetylglutamate synthase-like GNAT family acetyltransferase